MESLIKKKKQNFIIRHDIGLWLGIILISGLLGQMLGTLFVPFTDMALLSLGMMGEAALLCIGYNVLEYFWERRKHG